ncbi:hypothetical protein GCM10029976_034870 [Kribbella albertanoniae]
MCLADSGFTDDQDESGVVAQGIVQYAEFVLAPGFDAGRVHERRILRTAAMDAPPNMIRIMVASDQRRSTCTVWSASGGRAAACCAATNSFSSAGAADVASESG